MNNRMYVFFLTLVAFDVRGKEFTDTFSMGILMKITSYT